MLLLSHWESFLFTSLFGTRFQKLLTRRSPTSFPGFSLNRPYRLRERERDPGWVWSRIWRLQVNDVGEGQISARFVSTERTLVSGKCGHETVHLTESFLSSPLLSLRRDTKKWTLRTRWYGIIISTTRKKKMETFWFLQSRFPWAYNDAAYDSDFRLTLGHKVFLPPRLRLWLSTKYKGLDFQCILSFCSLCV